jgi:hypothetical protein
MKPLDDFIKNHAERFDSEEPLPGHFDRFEQRLGKTFVNYRKWNMNLFVRIAAVVIFGLVLSYFALREFQNLNRDLNYMMSADVYPELIEAEEYFTMQMDLYYNKIENLKFENDKGQKKLIMDELSSMDSQVKVLKHDLLQNPDNERVVHALINFYQVKLEFMDMIITRTQETNPTIL